MYRLSALKTALYALSIGLMYSVTNTASAADERWLGVWRAKDTLFTLRVMARDEFLHVEPVQSLGFLWRNSPGRINGDSAMFNVEYQGVVATVHVQLGENGTAIARPVSCRPDYHVVCALVQNQQALFQKVSDAAQSTD